MEWLIENVFPVLFIIFYIFLKITKVKQQTQNQKSSPQEPNRPNDLNTQQVQEELRRLIHERTHPSSEYLEDDLYPKNSSESILSSSLENAYGKSDSRTIVQEIPHKVASIYSNYEDQLENQRKKIEEARVLRKKILREEHSVYRIKTTSSQKTLKHVFATKSPLAQALLAKEILDKPKGFQSF